MFKNENKDVKFNWQIRLGFEKFTKINLKVSKMHKGRQTPAGRTQTSRQFWREI